MKGLNARNLTARLACSTKTLYQLVGNREAMTRAIVAHAFAGMDLEFKPGPDWQTSIKNWSRTLHSALLARPYLGTLMTLEDRDATVAYVKRLLDALVEHGFRTGFAIEVAGNVGPLDDQLDPARPPRTRRVGPPRAVRGNPRLVGARDRQRA